MNETNEDLHQLQRLLDASYQAGGHHLKNVIGPERRLDAAQLSSTLTGMRLLVLATTTSDGRPIAGPVDGVFFRGCFHFGSAPDSVRFRHLRQRPAVSATHLPGEELSVTVHGTAEELDLLARENSEFRQVLLDIYVPRYGADWETFLDQNVYARINPAKMFTFSMLDNLLNDLLT
jgi:nitroimidazol reductase NimA-like FMN-containing flavoprotein (pyridoxamine 5'-phosphate oxidase superfamily)